MKKITFSLSIVFLIGILSSSTFINSKPATEASYFIQGISGTVTRGSTPVAGKTVHISKGSFSTTATTSGNGYYQVLDGDLDGPGTYTVSVGWCVGSTWFHGSNSGYYNEISTTIDVSVITQKNGCQQ